MRIVTKKHIPRRTFLRGAGTMLALPLLDAMVPALTAQSKTAANALRRRLRKGPSQPGEQRFRPAPILEHILRTPGVAAQFQ